MAASPHRGALLPPDGVSSANPFRPSPLALRSRARSRPLRAASGGAFGSLDKRFAAGQVLPSRKGRIRPFRALSKAAPRGLTWAHRPNFLRTISTTVASRDRKAATLIMSTSASWMFFICTPLLRVNCQRRAIETTKQGKILFAHTLYRQRLGHPYIRANAPMERGD